MSEPETSAQPAPGTPETFPMCLSRGQQARSLDRYCPEPTVLYWPKRSVNKAGLHDYDIFVISGTKHELKLMKLWTSATGDRCA